MLGSSSVKRWSKEHRVLALLPFVVAYVAVTAFSTSAGAQAVSQMLEPIGKASSDTPSPTDSAVSLGGDLLP
jgi:hypothetical protein